MRGLAICKAAVVAGLGTAALAPAAPAGTVTFESQRRSVGVNVFVAPGDADFIDVSDRETTTELGLFEASTSEDSGRADYVAEGSASLRSTLGQDGFRFAGGLAFEVEDRGLDPGQGSASANVSARVVFSIDEPYRYDMTIDSTTIRSGGEVRPFGEIALRTNLEDIAVDIFTGESSGVLEPGRYRFDFLRGVGAGDPLFANDGFFAEEYDIAFALEEADGGDGTPIPLPPALWSGLALMGVGLVSRWRKSRIG